MDQAPLEEKKSFLHNDRLLVCSMLAFYGICILGLVAAATWGLNRRSQAIAAHATSTALAVATQQAKVTATAAARSAAQAQYSFIEPFDDNSRGWFVKTVNDDLMAGSIAIDGGLYVWNIDKVKKPFTYWSDFPLGNSFKDFDTYVDFKITATTSEGACVGFLFRMASSDWEQGAYTFGVCRNSRFYISYYKQEKWEMISDWKYSDSIRRSDWNRIEITARGDHFVFIINNEIVDEITDDHLSQGALALFIAADENGPATIWFDNFGFQTR